ncbi:hypothetical protein V5N11_018345 [Cardamine amara subsp. amara]|uniref:Uncharacterized protein n=1 Tax=Cardamine amara subsp. amara TaxID=228776 RepID=A0ABD0ZZ90_CARAN
MEEEKGEGEIPSSPKARSSGMETDGVWSQVVSSGGRKSSSQNLVYGQVKIASPSRFDILKDKDEIGENVLCSATDMASSASGETENVLDKSQVPKVGKEGTTQRVPIPRNTKSAYKSLPDAVQKAKDNNPSNLNKKKHKNNS